MADKLAEGVEVVAGELDIEGETEEQNVVKAEFDGVDDTDELATAEEDETAESLEEPLPVRD